MQGGAGRGRGPLKRQGTCGEQACITSNLHPLGPIGLSLIGKTGWSASCWGLLATGGYKGR